MIPHLCIKYDETPRGGLPEKLGGYTARFLKLLPYFRPKYVIFPTLFQTWSPARDKLLRHVDGWRKH